MGHGVAHASVPPLALRMTGRQLSNIMEYCTRTDVPPAPERSALKMLPPPVWRPMTAEDADLETRTIVLREEARIVPPPPCARAESGWPAASTLIVKTRDGERAMLIDRFEHGLCVAAQDEISAADATRAAQAADPRNSGQAGEALQRLAGAFLLRED